MRVVIAGGSGFLGRALVASLIGGGHQIAVLSRRPTRPPSSPPGRQPAGLTPAASPGSVREVGWIPDGTAGSWSREVAEADAVVNLAGHSIGTRRWTAAEKERILSSRILATRSLVEVIRTVAGPPPALISSSAIGFYGTSDDRLLDEQSSVGHGFLSEVCLRWEQEALRAERSGARVVLLRTGLVLAAGGGALPKMLRPFRYFAGGPVGSGEQFLSWIHLADWTALSQVAVERGAVAGPINLTAPSPVTSAEFAAAVGRALRRPSWMPAPAPLLRLALGEMADQLLLGGQRVLPAYAIALGYTFRFPNLDAALRDLIGGQGRDGGQETRDKG